MKDEFDTVLFGKGDCRLDLLCIFGGGDHWDAAIGERDEGFESSVAWLIRIL